MTRDPHTSPGPERRVSPRIEVELWVEELDGSGTYYHHVTNFSRNGIFIKKRLPFRVDSAVHLRLELPNTLEKVVLRGKVVRNYSDLGADVQGAGIRFMPLDDSTQMRIDRCIRHLATGLSSGAHRRDRLSP